MRWIFRKSPEREFEDLDPARRHEEPNDLDRLEREGEEALQRAINLRREIQESEERIQVYLRVANRCSKEIRARDELSAQQKKEDAAKLEAQNAVRSLSQ